MRVETRSPTCTQESFGQRGFSALWFSDTLRHRNEQLGYCEQPSVFRQTVFAETLSYLPAARVSGATQQGNTYCPDGPPQFTWGPGQPSALLNDGGLQPLSVGCIQCLCHLFSLC